MALKFEVDQVPEGLENYYTQHESGKFRLAVEGVVPESEYTNAKQKLKEFRDSNTKLMQGNQALSDFSAILGGGVNALTPEALQAKIDELANKRLEERAGAMRQKHEEEKGQLTQGLTAAQQRLATLMVSNEVRAAGVKVGIQDTAHEDAIMFAMNEFNVTDKGLEHKTGALDADGKPYTVETWLAAKLQTKPHWAKPSQGTGAKRPMGGVTPQPAAKSTIDKLSAGVNLIPSTRR